MSNPITLRLLGNRKRTQADFAEPFSLTHHKFHGIMLQKLMDQDHSSMHTVSTSPCTERTVCHFMLNANEKHFQGYQAFSAGVLRREVTFHSELQRGSIYTQSAEQALYFILRFGRKSIDKLPVQNPLRTLWASTTSCSSCRPGLRARRLSCSTGSSHQRSESVLQRSHTSQVSIWKWQRCV